LLATAHDDGVRLWDLAARREAAHLSEPGLTQTALFLPRGRGLLVYGQTGLTRRGVERTPEGGLRLGPPGRALDVPVADPAARPADVSSDGRRFAAADRANARLILLDTEGGEKVYLPGHPHVNKVALSPDGRWVASSTWGGPGVVRV